MKKYIFVLIIFLLTSCGSGGGSATKSSDYFKYQWNINPKSIYYINATAKKGADINLISAWEYNKGGGVKVAIIDDCFDVNHEDLKDNIYQTYNAYDDSFDVSGYDCHGTEVAGVLGASDNGFGIVGVAPKVKLILIKVDFKLSPESDYIKAFEYAKDQGAKVINCSWGSADHKEPQSFKNEFESLKNANITIVFASGNGDENNTKIDLDQNGIDDESEDPNVIGVGATDENNDVTYYSNYGKNIDILAPGGAWPLGIKSTSDNGYSDVAGTSFAAPTVSGVIALMYAKDPTLTFDDIYQKLTQSADKIGIENGANYINGFDTYRAYGKINAKNAIEY